MSTKFRPSDLVPAGFIAEPITHVADLPLSGRRVRLLVRRRRFTCDAVLCGRQIFAERFGDVLPPYARRTGRLEHLVHHLALALGGRPAARFAQRLMLPVSNDTLLRVIRRQGLPPLIPPSVIGIPQPSSSMLDDGRNFRQHGHVVASGTHVSSRSGGRISMQTFDSISAALRSMTMLLFRLTPEIGSVEGCTSRQGSLSEMIQLRHVARRYVEIDWSSGIMARPGGSDGISCEAAINKRDDDG